MAADMVSVLVNMQASDETHHLAFIDTEHYLACLDVWPHPALVLMQLPGCPAILLVGDSTQLTCFTSSSLCCCRLQHLACYHHMLWPSVVQQQANSFVIAQRTAMCGRASGLAWCSAAGTFLLIGFIDVSHKVNIYTTMSTLIERASNGTIC